MVRKRETIRKRKFYDQTALNEALVALTRKENRLSLKKASEKYGVPRATLYDRMSGRYPPIKLLGGSGRCLTDEEEASIVGWIKQRLEKNETVGKSKVLQAVKDLLDSNERKVKKFTANKPGAAWWDAFLNRHPDLNVRKKTKSKRKPVKKYLEFKYDPPQGKLIVINMNNKENDKEHNATDSSSSAIDKMADSTAVSPSKDITEQNCTKQKSRYSVALKRRRVPNSRYDDDYEWFPNSNHEETSVNNNNEDSLTKEGDIDVMDCPLEVGATVNCISSSPCENNENIQHSTESASVSNASSHCCSSEVVSVIAKAIKDISENSSRSADTDDLFFSSISSEVKKFPKQIRARLKLRILELVNETAEKCT